MNHNVRYRTIDARTENVGDSEHTNSRILLVICKHSLSFLGRERTVDKHGFDAVDLESLRMRNAETKISKQGTTRNQLQMNLPTRMSASCR